MYKVIATVQAVLLTAAMVHIYHLQGRQMGVPPMNDAPKAAPATTAPVYQKQYKSSDFELLPDMQTVQDEILQGENEDENDGPDAALFGKMRENGA